MTSLIFKIRMIAMAICLFASLGINAQESQMGKFINQSLAKVAANPSSASMLTCIAELKRIDSMFPDSVQPKFQMALQSFNYCVMNPQSKQTDGLLEEAQQTIDKMKGRKELNASDLSDIHTLQGFLYMCYIVQNPAANGQKYYLQVMDEYEKALKLNPDNELAKKLQEKFYEGMKRH